MKNHKTCVIILVHDRDLFLGPKNYCMYTKLVGKIIKRYNIK